MGYNLALFLVLPQALVYLLYFLASAKTIYFNGAEKTGVKCLRIIWFCFIFAVLRLRFWLTAKKWSWMDSFSNLGTARGGRDPWRCGRAAVPSWEDFLCKVIIVRSLGPWLLLTGSTTRSLARPELTLCVTSIGDVKMFAPVWSVFWRC